MKEGLVLKGVSTWHRAGKPVLKDIDLNAPRGCITALLGPNGVGKSSLLKAIIGLLPSSGEITLDGQGVRDLAPQARAKTLAYVPQRTQLMARLSVQAVVEMGRFAHRGPLSGLSKGDKEAVEQAMHDTHTDELAGRLFPDLSGGEQQRVLLARALATGANALLLDEPTSSLDVKQVLLLHTVLRRLAKRDCIILVVLHDLSEARQHVDRAVLLQGSGVALEGDTEVIISQKPIADVYGVRLLEGGGLGYALPEAGP